jgi:hypothetical protein
MNVSYHQSVDMVSLADFVNSKFFVCLHLKLASFLQGLLLDERNLEDESRGDVMIIAKRNAGKNQPFCSSR